MRGVLLDCHAEGNLIALWIKSGGRTVKRFARYAARVYVREGNRPGGIARLEAAGYPCLREVVRDLESDRLVEAVSVSTEDLEGLQSFVAGIERTGNYDLRLYNADLGAEQMFLFEHGLSPLCGVEVTGKCAVVSGIRRIADPETGLSASRIRVGAEEEPLATYETPIKEIVLDGRTIAGSERRILQEFKKLYQRRDPDIIIVDGGDSHAVDYILHRFRRNGIIFTFSREGQSFRKRDGKSYHSYGRVVRREPSHYLRGRFHIDSSSFMYREAGIDGILHLARTGCMPVQKVARLSPGAVITNLYIYSAYRKGYVIPYKVNMVEDFKTARTLFAADRGGFIYEPVTGFHANVAEIDFVSLYPHIMVNYNISPETMLCSCCAGESSVPYAGYHICRKRRGLVPEVLSPLIRERIELKRKFKESGDERYKAMATALKWILVTSFGYTGYRRSRFGRIEAHESITSYARHILLRSTRIAEDAGFTVLHGIVDSLWVKKEGMTLSDVRGLVERIEEEFDIPLDIGGIYRWIVFTPSVGSRIAPVPNRYYGVFDDGRVKVRGMELRRRDAPRIVKEFQAEVIDVFSSCASEEELRAMIPVCYNLLSRYKKRLMAGGVDWDDLVIKKSVSREACEYRSSTVQKVVLEKLAGRGIERGPGERVGYVIRDAGAADPRDRYAPAEDHGGSYDAGKYFELLAKSLESLILVFGFDGERILSEYAGRVQARLFD